MAKNPQNKTIKSNQPNSRMIDLDETDKKNDDNALTPTDGNGTITETETGDNANIDPTESNSKEPEDTGTTEPTGVVNPDEKLPEQPVPPTEEITPPSELDEAAIIKQRNIEKEVKKVKDSLEYYGSLMNKKCVYSTIESPRNQLLIINIFENVFVDTLDYDTMSAKVKFVVKFAADLAKTDDNWLSTHMVFRGLESVNLPIKRIENFCYLSNMVERFVNSKDIKKEQDYFSWENTFRYHPKQVTQGYLKTIMLDIFKI